MLLTSKEANLFHNREVIKIMRRMYSEQELSIIIHDVVGDYIEEGAFDEVISDAVDAYLVEHPVDPTAITGLDIAPKDVTASGNITAPSIIETMSGYSFTKVTSYAGLVYSYAGVVKNGNKITFAVAGTYTRASADGSNLALGTFVVPSAIADKLYPNSLGALANIGLNFFSSTTEYSTIPARMSKSTTNLQITMYGASALTNEATYEFRFEVTFLLSDTLIE